MLARVILLMTAISFVAGCQEGVSDSTGLDALEGPLQAHTGAVLGQTDEDPVTTLRVLVATYQAARGI